jgi:hypothetical protein
MNHFFIPHPSSFILPNPLSSPLTGFSDPGALSRLCSAAVVDPAFCRQLLQDPLAAIAAGYHGEHFCLDAREIQAILSIQAETLSDFAGQLLDRLQNLPLPILDGSKKAPALKNGED